MATKKAKGFTKKQLVFTGNRRKGSPHYGSNPTNMKVGRKVTGMQGGY